VRLRRIAAAVCLALWSAPPAWAQPSQRTPGLELTVGSSVQTDSNLFRLPDGTRPTDVGLVAEQRRDSLATPFAELTATAGLGPNQLLSARGRVVRDRFDRNRNFDATRHDADVLWRGSFTRQWRSELSHALERRATNFADFRSPERNILDTGTSRGVLSFQPRPDTRLSVLGTDFRGSNSIEARRGSDYRIGLYRAEISRSTAQGNEIVAGASRTEGRYPHRQIVGGTPVDNSYEQQDVDLALLWRPGESTSLTLRLGHAERDFDHVPERGFEGATWLASVGWQLGGKTLLRLSSQRDLNAVDDFDRVFAVSEIHRVSLVHSLTAKLSVGLDASRQRIDHRGDPQSVLTRIFGQRPPRADRIEEVRASVGWTPRDRMQVQLSATRAERGSNQPGLQYRATIVQMSLQYRAF